MATRSPGWVTCCKRAPTARSFAPSCVRSDGAGLDGGEETNDIVDALRGEDGYPIARMGDLLQTSADRAQLCAQLRPRQLHRAPGAVIVQGAGCFPRNRGSPRS